MAIERVWCLKSRTQDTTIATFADESVYGGAENDRNEEAHYIVIAKADENQNLTFIVGIDNSDPLNKLEYQIIQSVDGFYRLFAFNPPFYSGATNYTKEVKVDGQVTVYPHIVWHSASAKFYLAIEDSIAIEPSVTVGWATYWQVDPDFTLQISNSIKGNIHIHDDQIAFRFEDCLADTLIEVNDDIMCNVCTKMEDLFKPLAMQLMLAGANANNWQNKQTKSEVILVEATKRFCC